MGYVEKNLLEGEVVRFRTRLHWRLYLPTLLLSVFVLLPLAVFLAYQRHAAWSLLPIGVAVLLVGAAHVKRQASEFAVTNKRVMIKLGVVGMRSVEVLLSKVESIAVHQDMGGKLLDYGDIVVNGSGGTRETFSGIQRPLAFRRAIQSATDERETATRG